MIFELFSNWYMRTSLTPEPTGGIPLRPRIRTHHSQRGDPGPQRPPPASRHSPTDRRSGSPQTPSGQSPCRRYHRFRWRSHLRREDGDLLRACCPHRRSPEHGHAFCPLSAYMPGSPQISGGTRLPRGVFRHRAARGDPPGVPWSVRRMRTHLICLCLTS